MESKNYNDIVEKFSKEKVDELDRYIETTVKDYTVLIQVLHRAQHIFGYLPSEVQLHIAKKLNVSGAKVFGVVSFYSYFSMTPVGKHVINVCTGTACYVKGVEPVLNKFSEVLNIKPNETTPDLLFTLKDIRCIGACGLAPVCLVDDKVYGHLKPDDVVDIINEYKEV